MMQVDIDYSKSAYLRWYNSELQNKMAELRKVASVEEAKQLMGEIAELRAKC